MDELAKWYGWVGNAVDCHATVTPGSGMTPANIIIIYAQTKVQLVAQFLKTVPFSRLFKEVASYKARPGQNLGDYCFQKPCKLRKLDIDISDKYQANMVIGGIPDDAVARTVSLAKHYDPNALYAFMSTLGDMPSRGRVTRGHRVSITSRESRSRSTGIDGDRRKEAERPATIKKRGKGRLLTTSGRCHCGAQRWNISRGGATNPKRRVILASK